MAYDETEFRELLNAACDDRLTVDQAARLETILASDPAALRWYDQYMQLDLEMHFLARSLPENPPRVLAGRAARAGSSSLGSAAAASPPLLTIAYWRAHPGRFVSLAAALTVLLWCGFYFVIRPFSQGTSPETPPQGYVAQVTGNRSAVWAEGATPHALDTPLSRDSVLEISDGYVEITFEKGAVVVLEGPARFVTQSPGSGTLEYGRLVAWVESSEAGGFFVTTPLAQVIDFGTRFGVESSLAAGTEVEVFQGIVDATPLARGADGRAKPLRLAAGQAASLAVGDEVFELRASLSGQFVQSLPPKDADLPVRMIRPVAVSCSVEGDSVEGVEANPPERLIDGSGLATRSGESSLVHWGMNPEACCDAGDANCWKAPADFNQSAMLTFDLGREYELSGIHLWNYGHVEQGPFLGARQIEVSLSSDGENFEPFGMIWAPRAEDFAAEGHLLEIGGVGRYVRLEIMNNHTPIGDTPQPYVGLGEVRLEGKLVAPEAGE